MTDLISRDDAMGAVQDHFNAYGFKGYYDGQQMMDRINALPSAETDGWIPCSERLPSKKEVVLITNDKGNVRCGQFRGTDGKDWIWKGNTLETVLAWMPLPKQFEPQESEEKE